MSMFEEIFKNAHAGRSDAWSQTTSTSIQVSRDTLAIVMLETLVKAAVMPSVPLDAVANNADSFAVTAYALADAFLKRANAKKKETDEPKETK